MNTTEIVIAVLASPVLVKAIEWIKDAVTKNSPEQQMLRAIGSRELSLLLKDWKHSDIRLADDWADIEDLYKGYIALGGNGRIKKLYEECKKIPTTE